MQECVATSQTCTSTILKQVVCHMAHCQQATVLEQKVISGRCPSRRLPFPRALGRTLRAVGHGRLKLATAVPSAGKRVGPHFMV